ncbi:MAG: type I-E CRISPR-associated protein Cse2/CasB [Polyangiaceae bacterium]|nr:type I-E CRISPR-associated protein Cse2/CasB [Polyangiaceae bacterium]
MSHSFIDALVALRDDRAALAALRRGLGQTPGTAASLYPYVVPFLPKDATRWQEQTYFLIASLFALHPAPGGDGTSIGDALRRLKGDSGSTEARFVALMESHPDDLALHLRHAVSLIRSKEIPIDWERLFGDVWHWTSESRWVQRRWARDFWSDRPAADNQAADQGADGGAPA